MGWWDHQQGGWGVEISPTLGRLQDAGFNPQPGTDVTITVEPQHMTGDWYLAIGPH